MVSIALPIPRAFEAETVASESVPDQLASPETVNDAAGLSRLHMEAFALTDPDDGRDSGMLVHRDDPNFRFTVCFSGDPETDSFRQQIKLGDNGIPALVYEIQRQRVSQQVEVGGQLTRPFDISDNTREIAAVGNLVQSGMDYKGDTLNSSETLAATFDAFTAYAEDIGGDTQFGHWRAVPGFYEGTLGAAALMTEISEDSIDDARVIVVTPDFIAHVDGFEHFRGSEFWIEPDPLRPGTQRLVTTKRGLGYRAAFDTLLAGGHTVDKEAVEALTDAIYQHFVPDKRAETRIKQLYRDASQQSKRLGRRALQTV